MDIQELHILNANGTPKNTKYSRNDKISKTRENEKSGSMGRRLKNTFNSKKKTQFGKIAHFAKAMKIIQKMTLDTHRVCYRGKTAKSTFNI